MGPAEPVLGHWSLIEPKIVGMAVSKMKIVKASGVVAEILKAAGDVGVRLVTTLLNAIIRVGSVLYD